MALIKRGQEHVIRCVTSDCLLKTTHRTSLRKMSNNSDGVELEPKKKGGRYCVAGGPNKQSCKNTSYTPGITMHQFPKDGKVRQEWVRFVRRHRPNYTATSKYAALCSTHFEESSFLRPSIAGTNIRWRRNLIPGAVPTRDAVSLSSPKKLSQRGKRQVTK